MTERNNFEPIYEECDNKAVIKGRLNGPWTFSHAVRTENFYKTTLAVMRNSGNIDYVPIIASERVLDNFHEDAEFALCYGRISTHREKCPETGKMRLSLFIFVESIEACEEGYVNDCKLQGFITKPPVYRKTGAPPDDFNEFNRNAKEITDLMIAVNRRYGRSDYIPCICWGKNARYAGDLLVGDQVVMNGRFQSREYTKTLEGGKTVHNTAYEFSAYSVDLIASQDGIR